MAENIPSGWDVIGAPPSNENQIKEPNRPAHFLKSLIDKAPNAEYPENDKRNDEVKKRRELIRACAEKIEDIGRELAEAFVATYAKHGLLIHGGLRFYVVGGRLEAKPLRESSDLDCAFTVVDSNEAVHPKYGEDQKDLVDKKRAARREFVYGPLRDIVNKYGYMTTDVTTQGETIIGPLLEPKEYGSTDEAFRKRNLPAVLIAAVPPVKEP